MGAFSGDVIIRLVGVSCIAKGADALFAEAVLEVGGRLVVVMPSEDYRGAKVKSDHLPIFDRLLEAAAEVVVMDHKSANREAYEAANRELLRRADRLVAARVRRAAADRPGAAPAQTCTATLSEHDEAPLPSLQAFGPDRGAVHTAQCIPGVIPGCVPGITR